ncbi:hypothetical protein phiP47_005 [Plesiomonas phage phiP4-7]|nr:hypothetical protein phiP47_005 [Plesiomonas phage phiP4-7]
MALVAVAISKLYTQEDQTFKTIIRSFLAATLFSFLFVLYSANGMSEWMIYATIVVGSFIIDGIAEALAKLRARIKEDPTIILKFIPYLSKGGKK